MKLDDKFSHLLKKKGKVSRAVDELYGTLKFARKLWSCQMLH